MSQPASFGDTLGAIELGGYFSAIILGVALVQVYNYYQRELNDNRLTKSLVCLGLVQLQEGINHH